MTPSTSLPLRVRVAVPVHLYDCFDYVVTETQYQQATLGARVAVSFGRQHLIGIIVEKLAADTPVDPRFQLKSIDALLDEHTLLDANILKLLTWSAQYYLFPLGEVMQSALPTLLRQGKPYDLLARTWQLTDLQAEAKISRSPKQQEAYKILKLKAQGTLENILNLSGIESSTLKALEKKALPNAHLNNWIFPLNPFNWHKCPLNQTKTNKKPFKKS